jgi:hypothetical protein
VPPVGHDPPTIMVKITSSTVPVAGVVAGTGVAAGWTKVPQHATHGLQPAIHHRARALPDPRARIRPAQGPHPARAPRPAQGPHPARILPSRRSRLARTSLSTGPPVATGTPSSTGPHSARVADPAPGEARLRGVRGVVPPGKITRRPLCASTGVVAVAWRWRESNPRPSVPYQGFSGCSLLCFSWPRRSRRQVADGLSRCKCPDQSRGRAG